MVFKFILNQLIFVIASLVAVAFVTLLERKILGYMQIRLGPNKVGFTGIFQPFSDAVKLYSKELVKPNFANLYPFFLSPCMSLMISLSIWMSLPYFSNSISLAFSLMLFLAILSMGVYPILLSGWASNSSYSMLGAMRALAQTISYEVSLMFIIMSIMFMAFNFNLFSLILIQKFCFGAFFSISVLMWLISILAELNRTPFDFAEGESELVSGFNTEYSSASFAIIFMAEYMMILFFSMLTAIMFFSFNVFSPILMATSMLIMFFIIWVRATLPRYRYDKLMFMCWKLILPLAILNLILMSTFSLLIL